jgi:1-aminocyclopropane-1-carboxylate deaminase/D-cysteine desulfhydrase-like pyridoxal-dependent ACC family enzyme
MDQDYSENACVSDIRLLTQNTPLERFDNLYQQFGFESIYIKRDDLIDSRFGCSKVRIIHALIKEAVAKKYDSLLCTAFSGSSMVAALSYFSMRENLPLYAVVKKQSYSESAFNKIKFSLMHKCQFVVLKDFQSLRHNGRDVQEILQKKELEGRSVYQIMFSGSGEISIKAYIAAGIELAEQIKTARIKCEEIVVYLPSATGALAFGVSIGLHIAKCNSKVVWCALSEIGFKQYLNLFRHSKNIRRKLSLSKGELKKISKLIEVRKTWNLSGFSQVDNNVLNSIEQFHKKIGIILDQVYSSKVFYQLTEDCNAGGLQGKTPLFWLSGAELEVECNDDSIKKDALNLLQQV